jgi:hypothetical protein
LAGVENNAGNCAIIRAYDVNLHRRYIGPQASI